MFWSMKKSSERQKPSPMAPKTAPSVREEKSTTSNRAPVRDESSKLFPTGSKLRDKDTHTKKAQRMLDIDYSVGSPRVVVCEGELGLRPDRIPPH